MRSPAIHSPAYDVERMALQVVEVAPHVELENARSWVAQVMETEPDRIAWHVRRLFGFGGSDMGVLIMAARGLRHPFSSVRDIVAQKLCLQAPEPASGHTARGTVLEPIARDQYRAAMRAREHGPYFDALERYHREIDKQRFPWQQGNPDDILQLEGGRILVPDYKVPGDPDEVDELVAHGAPLYYEAQLHHYANVMTDAGLRVDALSLAAFSTRRWEAAHVPVEFDRSLASELQEIGQAYWNDFVLAGELPPYEGKLPRERVSMAELPDDVMDLQRRLVAAKKLESQAKSAAKTIRSRVLRRLAEEGMQATAEQGVRAGLIDWSVRTSERVDQRAALKRLAELGEDPDQFKSRSESVYVEALRTQRGAEAEQISSIDELAKRYVDSVQEVAATSAVDAGCGRADAEPGPTY